MEKRLLGEVKLSNFYIVDFNILDLILNILDYQKRRIFISKYCTGYFVCN